MRRARFEGAFLRRTRYEGTNNLEGAHFGDLGRAELIFVGQQSLDDPDKIKAWVTNVTGQPGPVGELCQTGLQLLHMFGKFVTPLGSPRRDDIPRRALLAGRRYASAAAPEECLEQAIRHGFVTGPDFRDRFRRAEGDKYAEMVSFVRDGKVSDSLGRAIAPICRRRACVHQVRS